MYSATTDSTPAPRSAWRPPRGTHPLERARAQLQGAIHALEERASDFVVGSALHAAMLEVDAFLREARAEDGPLNEAQSRAPRLRHAAKRLRAEAGRVLRRLRALSLGIARTAPAGGAPPIAQLRRLKATLGRLRERETQLILDAEEALPALD